MQSLDVPMADRPLARSLSKTKRRIGVFEIVMIVLTLVFLYPFYVMITESIKTETAVLLYPFQFPRTFDLGNFVQAWKLMDYGRAFLNNCIITIVGVGGIVLVTGMCSFTLAVRRSRVYQIAYYVIICGVLVPFYMMLTPLVEIMKVLHLLNSLLGAGLVDIGRGVPFAVFLYVGFIRGVPKEVREAAQIDGCSPYQLYWRVYFPILKPITATLIILDSLWIWNEFLFPFLVLSNPNHRTLVLAQYVFFGEYSTQWNLVMAALLMTVLPLVIVFFFLQRYIVEGITLGAVKG